MDGCPPYGDFPGGEAFDPGAMPDTWEPGPMTDMGPEFGPGTPPEMGPGPDGPPGPPPGMDMDGDAHASTTSRRYGTRTRWANGTTSRSRRRT